MAFSILSNSRELENGCRELRDDDMKQETRQCQNCKNEFVIEPDDFAFYEKIHVPPPTFCPECRFERRMTWRNDWHLFKKREARTGEEMIFSLFPDESPVKIYDKDFWNSDQWDPMTYGRDYDWDRSFFEQFKDLFHTVPIPAHSYYNLSNCEYCTNANNLKNCYLVRGASASEDSAYLIWDQASKHCFDSHMTSRCELGYGNVNTTNCYKSFFSVDCEDCQEIVLCRDCIGCNNCVGCVGLRNQSYAIFNHVYPKEEYMKRLEAFNIGSSNSFETLKRDAFAFWRTRPHKYMHGRRNINASGDYIHESKNAYLCYRARGMEDTKYCANILRGPVKDCRDYANWGQNAELMYECLVSGDNVSNIKFCTQVYRNVRNIEYSIFCHDAADLFGCVGIRNKQYCVFNKQFSKAEYENLVHKIKQHMDAVPYTDGAGRIYRYGEFFPSELSPFSYEVTAAYEFNPLSEAEARRKGFVWYPVKKQEYKITLRSSNLPDSITDAKDDLLNAVVECAHRGECKEECTGAFRIIKTELNFCRRMNIPLPRLCPNCRHHDRLQHRNPPKFWHRACACSGAASENGTYKNTTTHFHNSGRCPNGFETSYAPDRPEIVYCEACYNSEVV